MSLRRGCRGARAAPSPHAPENAATATATTIQPGAAVTVSTHHAVRASSSLRRVRDSNGDVLARYDDNGNGRSTCKKARRHGIAPVRRGNPAYRYMRHGDGYGIVCE